MKKSVFITAALLAASGASAAPIDRIMEHLDTDGDGLISQNEFQPPERRGMLNRLDTNDDGVVTLEEFEAEQAKMAARIAEKQSQMSRHFAAADADGDGMVTSEEARQAAFLRIDADADGYLSEEELISARPHGGPGRHGGRQPRSDKTI